MTSVPFARRIWAVPDLELAVALPTKAGCTSIRAALGKVASTRDMRVWEHGDESVPGHYLKACPVRSPWERVRSCWADKIMADRIRPELRAMGCRPQMPFDAFVAVVARTPDDRLDRHLAPLHWLVRSPRWSGPDMLLRVESMAADWARLRARRPALPPLPRLNLSRAPKPQWSPESVAAIAERYREDIALLGYAAPDPSLFDSDGFTDKASRNPDERRLYEDCPDYLTAYARHTDLRIRRDGPELAIGGQWEEHGPLQLRFLAARGLRPCDTLLDLGCGTGRLARHAVPWLDPGSYTGLEISGGALAHCRALAAREGWSARRPRLLRGDGTLAAVRGGRFSIVWAHSVFNHLPPSLIDGLVAGLREIAFGAFYFTWKHAEAPRRSGLKQWQLPWPALEEIASRHGFRATQRPEKWPGGQRTGEIAPS